MSENPAFVEETRFGNWFLNTSTWKVHVLSRALNDLQRLMPATPVKPRILDVGCGFGHSFDELAARFKPESIVAIDADAGLFERAQELAKACPSKVQLKMANASQIDFADASFDLLFCHQTFHHIVDQQAAMAEFFRVLKPGAMLLFAESTKRYIHSLPIRVLFRHPMHVQRTADEYLAMVRDAGFDVPESRISLPFLWWSRPDLGLLEKLGVPVSSEREETLINLVAVKPVD